MTKEPVRCDECIRRKMCAQTMEIFGRRYKVNYCSAGERKITHGDNGQESKRNDGV